MSSNRATIFYLAILHLGALAAPFCFSWSAFWLFAVLYVVTSMGVTLGFHRCLTHGAFETHAWVRWLLAFVGGLAGEGGVLQWVADHRKHHRFTDKPGDPHSPHDGFWWSHIVWTWHNSDAKRKHYQTYCPDLLADPVVVLIDRTFLLWHFILAVVFFYLGGWSWLVWGVFLRLTLVLNATWAVNSICHKWGNQPFKTGDESRNVWWVALLTNGEGWHNAHHAFPTNARHGLRWYQYDSTYWLICVLEFLGLAWDVKRLQGRR